MRAAAEQFQKVAAIGSIHFGIRRIQISLQWNVHTSDHQFVGRKLLEYVSDKVQLSLTEVALILTLTTRFRGIEAEIIDIIEHQKQRAAVFERIIGWSVNPLECLPRISCARCLVI